MRFGVQSITKILNEDGKSISHYEIDLVDYQMSSDWQSSITLRVARQFVENYFVGQQFILALDEVCLEKHEENFKAYHDANHNYAFDTESEKENEA